jgi:hypothetical protein
METTNVLDSTGRKAQTGDLVLKISLTRRQLNQQAIRLWRSYCGQQCICSNVSAFVPEGRKLAVIDRRYSVPSKASR